MNETTICIVGLVLLLALFATGIEMSFAMALIGFVGFAYLNGFTAAVHLIGGDLFEAFTNYGYTVFPLFMLMGQIGLNAGIAQRLYNSANKFIGHIPGGLAMATVVGAAGFKAICGSSTATAATFASVAIPEMNRYNYDKRLSTGIVATVGTLGCLLPPSVVLILYGIITEQSIGKLFMAGIIPGLLIAAFFVVIIYGWAKMDPKIAPPVGAVDLEGEGPHPAGDRLGPDDFCPGRRRDHVGLFHPFGGGRRRLFRSAGPVRCETGHDLQDLRQIGGGDSQYRRDDPDDHCRLGHPRPFHGRHQCPPETLRLGPHTAPEPVHDPDHHLSYL
jgi:hypothetical protein